ncbi:unannotated protein [freshwater metagenome]|uniref:Unannotated protein n=1 Tax=freshwater metagenome TaxID=449393 RepID=A0A6J6RM80_9ZZZZ
MAHGSRSLADRACGTCVLWVQYMHTMDAVSASRRPIHRWQTVLPTRLRVMLLSRDYSRSGAVTRADTDS